MQQENANDTMGAGMLVLGRYHNFKPIMSGVWVNGTEAFMGFYGDGSSSVIMNLKKGLVVIVNVVNRIILVIFTFVFLSNVYM